MKKYIINFLTALVLLAGIALMFYPFLADWYNQLHQGGVIRNYDGEVANINQEDLDAERARAQAYNRALLGSVELTDPFESSGDGAPSETYYSILNIGEDGMMGYIRIPVIKVKLPIYHGTSEEVLEKGVGHMEQTSFPIGGESSHTVLSAHTGSPAAELFTNLDQLEEGDLFFLEVLGETLAYQIDQIKVVEPDDIDSLLIEPSKDYATLVTCTPYGINSHRLLVRGERTVYIEEHDENVAGQNVVKSKRFIIMLVCLSLLAVSIIIFMIVRKKTKLAK